MQRDPISRFDGWARLAEFESAGLESNKAPTVAELVAAVGWLPFNPGSSGAGPVEGWRAPQGQGIVLSPGAEASWRDEPA